MHNKKYRLLFEPQCVRLLKQKKCLGLTYSLLRTRYTIYFGVCIYLVLR